MRNAAFVLFTSFAVASAHPVVPGFERFYADDKADKAAGGHLLIGELNCASCHQADGQAKKQAPVLDGVAYRVQPAYLSKFLADPHALKPGTTMPNLFAGDPEAAAKVEALTHFLATTGSLKQEKPDAKVIQSGRDLYAKVGCVACHGPRDAVGLPEKNLPAYIVPLGDLKAKYSITGLAEFLSNPLAVRPSGRMPHLLAKYPDAKKDANDPRDIANYLLQGVKVSIPQGVGSTSYSYYETGNIQKLPDFAKLKPKASGASVAFDLGVAKRGGDYAIKFEGYFKIDNEGQYKFWLTSDDGSQLFVDDNLVVNHDGIHAPSEVTASARLDKGIHKVTLAFFNGGGGAELSVDISGNGIPKQSLGGLVAATRADLEKKKDEPKKADDSTFVFNPELAAKGKALFTSVGCANCHQLNENKKPLVSTLTAKPLAALAPGGCAAAKPGKGLPDYSLNERQQAALQAALKAGPAKEPTTPGERVAKTMTTLNCYACHSRDKIGGPTEETNKWFLTVQPEMGDEGRIPPLLDGVGAKLNPTYFKQILEKGAHDRPYMHTRMPGFGAANVGHLQPLFASLDSVPTVAEVTFAEPMPKVFAQARHMVGEQALACIKCHTFAGVKAEGIQGIDMTLMPKRLNRDWFHFYMLDPQKYRPGTRMPSAFLNNMSPFPDVLDGKAATQIEAMWAYLKQGNQAALPLGMGKKTIPLRPIKEAIIYRNFIQGAGPRAIGVGYPEKVNLAWDANEFRLALIWQGAFIDAARHWEGRGVGFEGPLGDNTMALHAGVPFAVLAKPDSAWPTDAAKSLGYKFLGYRTTDDDRPTLDYVMNDVKIEDFPTGVKGPKDPFLSRTFTLSTKSTVDGLHYRAAVGKKIEAEADGWYKVDGWKTRIIGATPVIRTVDGKQELIVPVQFKQGQAKIVQEYVW